MQKRKLGSDGPEISVVGFGAWEAGGMGWGENPPDEQTIRAMQVALDNGITWIDTAEVYGGGRSEELVGQAVKGRPEAMVFTKVAPKPGGTGFAPDEIRAAAEASLKRLGRDVIDLFQLHWPDESIEIEETWQACAALVDEGKVRYIGVSNFGVDLLERCEAVRHVDSLQPQFSMLRQRVKTSLFPYCESKGIGIICYGPLAYGLLTGVFDKDTKFSDDDWRSGKQGLDHYYEPLFSPGNYEKNLEKVDALRPIADRLGITLPQLALAWVWHQPGVTGAIAGSRSPEHVEENAGAGSVELEAKNLDEIASILDP
ncbi:MAG TPA: aldo/keto reductase [Actinomycetota bacterium]|nr:aldo/keto reductase [Actinomycetota bacterium]